MTPECNLLYMITPLKKSFNDSLREKREVQEELDEMRSSLYKHFIYFPFSEKLITIIKDLSKEI